MPVRKGERESLSKKSPRLESTSCLFPPLCLSTLRLAQSVRIVQAGGNDGGGGGDRKEKDFVLKGVREIKFEFFVRVVMVGNEVVLVKKYRRKLGQVRQKIYQLDHLTSL